MDDRLIIRRNFKGKKLSSICVKNVALLTVISVLRATLESNDINLSFHGLWITTSYKYIVVVTPGGKGDRIRMGNKQV